MKHLSVLAGVVLAAAALPAHAVVIDFETLAFDGDTASGPRGVASPLVIGDFTFTATDPFGLPPILVYSRQSTNNPDQGGASIFPNRTNTGITIARTDGAAFTFNGLDLTYAYDDQNQSFTNGTATFTFNGGASSQTRDFDNLAGFETLNLNAAGITSVQITGTNPFVIDNVRLDELSGAVPEPAAWALMLVGFAGIGTAMRRHKPARVRFA